MQRQLSEAAQRAAQAGDWPHPDVPVLLERLASPSYQRCLQAPRSWGEGEAAHLVRLAEDEGYRR